MQHHIQQHLETIRRELHKRESAYPKILEKERKAFKRAHDHENLSLLEFSALLHDHLVPIASDQARQYNLLKEAENYILLTKPTPDLEEPIYRELRRERAMRRACYPRWVHFRRLDADTAAREIAEWDALTTWWHATYCPEVPYRKPRDRKTATAPTT